MKKSDEESSTPPRDEPEEDWSAAHAKSYLRAILDYTAGFYGDAIKHGMPARDTANKMAHLERAARGLERIAQDAIAKARTVTQSEKVASVKYMRYPKLDRRFVAGDDFAGDAYVRWVAVGQKPDDAADISEPPKHEAMVTASMIDAAAAACEQPPFLRDIGRLDLARIIRAALEAK